MNDASLLTIVRLLVPAVVLGCSPQYSGELDPAQVSEPGGPEVLLDAESWEFDEVGVVSLTMSELDEESVRTVHPFGKENKAKYAVAIWNAELEFEAPTGTVVRSVTAYTRVTLHTDTELRRTEALNDDEPAVFLNVEYSAEATSGELRFGEDTIHQW